MIDKSIFQLCHSINEKEALELHDLNPVDNLGNFKKDGDRIIGIITPEKDVLLLNRRGIEKSKFFPEVTEALKKFPADTIVDGEVISYDDDFTKLTRRSHTSDRFKAEQLRKEIPVRFFVFDILKDKGQDVRALALRERLERLKVLFQDESIKGDISLELAEYLPIPEMLKLAHDTNSEGIIVKDMTAPYLSKRSRGWLKMKFFEETTLTVTKYEENPKGITVEDDDGNRVAVLGGQSAEVKRRIDSEHQVEINIQFLEKTKDGRFRMPSFRGLKEAQ